MRRRVLEVGGGAVYIGTIWFDEFLGGVIFIIGHFLREKRAGFLLLVFSGSFYFGIA